MLSPTDRLHRSFRFRRLYSRVKPPTAIFREPPIAPLGVKLELTYACNLRCGFCYTDSPRRTLQRSTDMPDEDWRRVVDEAIELGIVEAVVTGGEPLLRRELTLDVIEALTAADVGVAFNTNGWFVDDAVVDRLAGCRGLTVHLSIDGAAPHLHDASRGVPGSWRRAVEGVDRLLTAGVNVCVVHVITPDNEPFFDEMLEQMWMLGVPWIRPTPVVLAGAAARGGDWSVHRPALRQIVQEFERRHGTAMKIDLRPGTAGELALQGHRAPGSMLIRPDGTVRVDSMHPFSYGNAAKDGLGACWGRIREGWQDQRVRSWTASMNSPEDLGRSDLVPYLDDEVPVAGAPEPNGDSGGRDAPVPVATPPKPVDPAVDLDEAAALIRGMALERGYRLGAVRAGRGRPRIVRRSEDGSYLRLNEAACVVMDALASGSPREGTEALRLHGAPAAEAELDSLRATRDLVARGVVVPVGSREDGRPLLQGPWPI